MSPVLSGILSLKVYRDISSIWTHGRRQMSFRIHLCYHQYKRSGWVAFRSWPRHMISFEPMAVCWSPNWMRTELYESVSWFYPASRRTCHWAKVQYEKEASICIDHFFSSTASRLGFQSCNLRPSDCLTYSYSIWMFLLEMSFGYYSTHPFACCVSGDVRKTSKYCRCRSTLAVKTTRQRTGKKHRMCTWTEIRHSTLISVACYSYCHL